MYQNTYSHHILRRYVAKNHILCKLCTGDLRANQICSSESISCMVRRKGGTMLGRKLTGLTSFNFGISDELGTASVMGAYMRT
jgi:hypothetical protein